MREQICTEKSKATGSADQALDLTSMFLCLTLTLLISVISFAQETTIEVREISHEKFCPKALGTVYIGLGQTEESGHIRMYGQSEYLAPCSTDGIRVEPFSVRSWKYFRRGKQVDKIAFRIRVSVAPDAQMGTYYAPVYVKDVDGRPLVQQVRIVVNRDGHEPLRLVIMRNFDKSLHVLMLILLGIVFLGVIAYLIIRILNASTPLEEEEGEDVVETPEAEEAEETEETENSSESGLPEE